jgi:hypothetical protein
MTDLPGFSIKSDSSYPMRTKTLPTDSNASHMTNDARRYFNRNCTAKKYIRIANYSFRLKYDKYRIPNLGLTLTPLLDQANPDWMGA